MFGPDVRIATRVDQLGAHANSIEGALDTAFNDVRDTQDLRDFTEISLRASLYFITLVRLITFKSAILARSDKISSCTPPAKNAFSSSLLRFSNGSTAMLLSEIGATFETVAAGPLSGFGVLL